VKKYNLIRFALKFAVIAAVLLAVFYFVFPYYRLVLGYVVGIFYDVTKLRSSERIFLTFMPYVSLTALILATPKRNFKEKIKFIALTFVLFYIIDIFFLIVQILLQGTSIKYYHILIVQDFLTIALPIAIWFLLDYKELIVFSE
jgi:hypothetical protein